MDQIVDSGSAADALRINQLYQVQTRSGYWKTGGAVNPGSSTTQIEVDVEAGDAQVSGSAVSWSATSVALNAADTDPRVDVVYVRSDGTFGVATGTPHAYRPNTDENGDPITPAPFEHWEPAPDDGGNVPGLPLACVLVKPSVTDSTDITTSEIQDRRLAASSNSEYVKGNGTDNGQVTITADDSDVVLKDSTDSVANYLWRDHSQGTLKIGSPNAVPTLRERLNANGNAIDGVNNIEVTAPGGAALDLTPISDGNKILWEITDGAATNPTDVYGRTQPGSGTAFKLGTSASGELFNIGMDGSASFTGGGGVDFASGALTNVDHLEVSSDSGVVIDLTTGSSDGTHILWRHDDGGSTQYEGLSRPGNNNAFMVRDSTNGQPLFTVHNDGTADLAGGDRVATRPWTNNNFLSSSGGTVSGSLTTTGTLTAQAKTQLQGQLEIPAQSADPPAPASGYVRIYQSGTTVEAKDASGNIATLGTF